MGATRKSGAVGALLLSLLAACLAVPARASVKRIWAVDDTEKIKREDLSNPLAAGSNNPVWSGARITLFGAKNEILAFQVIIEADGAGARGVNVQLDSLTGSGYVIKNAGTNDPFDYRGKRIELFTVLYWNVTESTTTGTVWNRGAEPSPYHRGGWLPVAMVPFQAPAGLGGAPFSVPANMNQAVWVDLLIPRDAPAGSYAGNLVVTDNDAAVAKIPVLLDVYEFALPDVTHLKNFFWGNPNIIASKHGVSRGSATYNDIEGRYHQMAHRHRMDLSLNGNLDWVKSHYQRYLKGSYYTSAYGYEGPGEGAGHGTYSIGTYDQGQGTGHVSGKASGWTPDDKAGWQANSDLWVTWFTQNAPQVEIFKYMFDEPKSWASTYPQIWQDIRDRAAWVHANPGPGKALRIFNTVDVGYPELDGYVDFWSSHPVGYDLAKADAQRAKGAKVGLYNGYRPFGAVGCYVYDVEAADARVIPWIAWRYGLDQYFFWNFNNYEGQNPFQSIPISVTNHRVGNGILMLPGEQKDFVSDSRGLPGPVATFIMKAWRRGQQDYEYLWLAKQRGLGSQAAAIASAVVPRALSDAYAYRHEPVSWPLHGSGFESYRKQLAKLLGAPPNSAGRQIPNPRTH